MSIFFRIKRNLRGLLLWLLLCCSYSIVHADPMSYILHIELSPAVCKIDISQKRTRQCLEGYSLTVSGLYPQNTNKSCETSSLLNLTPVQKRILMRIMPDENQQARLWRSVGGCVSMNANQYFRLVTDYAERLKVPAEISTPTNLRVGKEWLEKRFIQLNQGMSTANMELSCGSVDRRSTPLLTHVQVCYQTNGRYTTCQIQQKSTCPTNFVIQGSY